MEQFEKMCRTDILGVADEEDGEFDHKLFQDQFTWNGKCYQTALPWRLDHPELKDNRAMVKSRLESTTDKLVKMRKLKEYDKLMQEQIETGIMVPVPAEGQIKNFIPHHGVFKESKTTPLRIVYDLSSKPTKIAPSLNSCLFTGPPMQPKIMDILMKARMSTLFITADIAKAFHNIVLRPEEWPYQVLMWYSDLEKRQLQYYYFTKVIFGSKSSPYLLNCTIQKHLERYKNPKDAEVVKALKTQVYVDDVCFNSNNEEDIGAFKSRATDILQEGGFQLRK